MRKSEGGSTGYSSQHQIYGSGPYISKNPQQQRHHIPYEGPSEAYNNRPLASVSTNSLASSPYSSGGGVGSGAPIRTYYYSSATPPEILTHHQQHPVASDSGAPSSPAEISPSTASSPVGAPAKQYRTTTTTITTNSNGNNPPNERMDSYQPHPNNLHHSNTLQNNGRHSGGYGGRGFVEPEPPSYQVEHLASFAVGRQFGLQTPADGVRKLKQMEKNSAIWAQPMLLKLYQDRVSVEEENGELVEQFLMELIVDPTAHQSNDPSDMFNNVLLFVVKEDTRNGRRNYVPTEMHIFQCVRVSAKDVAEDLHHFIKGNFKRVRPGLRGSSDSNGAILTGGSLAPLPSAQRGPQYRDDISAASNNTEYFEMDVNTLNRCFDDIERFVARIQSAAIAQRELEIHQHRLRQRSSSKRSAKEAAAAAQHGILQLRAQMPTYNEFYEVFQKFKLSFNLLAKLKNHIHEPNAPELLHFLFTPLTVILDACNWGLGRNIAELVLSPLLSLDACELLRNCLTSKECDVWMALGKSWRTPPEDWINGVLPPPYRPVFSDGFAPYGYPFQQPFDSTGHPTLPPPPQPTQQHSSIYGHHMAQQSQQQQRYSSAPAPIHRGVSAPIQPHAYGGIAPISHRETSVDNLNFERINLEKERLEFERKKVLDREQQLLEQEKRLRQEEARLEAERRLLHKEAEKHSIAGSDRPDFYRRENASSHTSPRMDRRTGSVQVLSNGHVSNNNNAAASPSSRNLGTYAASNTSPRVGINNNGGQTYNSSVASPPISVPDQSPRQKAFLDELMKRNCKIVQVTYDRVAQNPKELTVARGEYLEILNDAKNWWECRNVHNRLGYVPHTILSVICGEGAPETHSIHDPIFVNAAQQDRQNQQLNSPPPHHINELASGIRGSGGSSLGGNSLDDTPEYIRQRQGKRGEFRYF